MPEKTHDASKAGNWTTGFLGNAKVRQSLDEALSRIVEFADPEKVILFGSCCRGAFDPGDIDLLIIKSKAHRRHLAADLYRRLVGVGHSFDLVVATPEDIERYGGSPSLILYPALREGRVVYAR